MSLANISGITSIQECLSAINGGFSQQIQEFRALMEIPELRQSAIEGIKTVMAMKSNAMLIAIGHCCRLPKVLALGTAMNAYFSCFLASTPPEVIARYQREVMEALPAAIAELNRKSELALREDLARAQAAERQTHNWLWRVFH